MLKNFSKKSLKIFQKPLDKQPKLDYYININQAKEPQQMKIKVLALTVGKYFTDGQHLVNEIEAAYKHPEQIEYYLSTAKQRGLDFGVKEDFIEIQKEDFEMWHNVYGATPV